LHGNLLNDKVKQSYLRHPLHISEESLGAVTRG
jgi:hypothetical protein